ncbi:MAG: agmatine deiminase family protein [Bacteroidetes bacterium]|nr:agmatine deiminase family protein [Bacteroidota bacterium]
MIRVNGTPKQLGYRFPAEWEPQAATWLSWAHKEESWPGKFEPIPYIYTNIVRTIAQFQHVHINVVDQAMYDDVMTRLTKAHVPRDRFTLHLIPTNDAWCRDHGPAFVVNPNAEYPLAIVDWNYNAWGGKYPPYDLDDVVPTRIAEERNLPVFYPGIIMEGGAIDVNGDGCLLTTKACLLNPNRNPHLSQQDIEVYLKEYYGQEKILWLENGIVGDDTDGHVDDLARFVNPTTIVVVVEDDPKDENYEILQENLRILRTMTDKHGNPFRIVELPMPHPLFYDGQRLPASYANFLIGNGFVLVPTFQDKNDLKALTILQNEFPTRKVIGIDCIDLVWGLGTLHCISQQEPAVIHFHM